MSKKLTPLVSIITVVYNGEKYLEQTILSVINQSYINIEYIIIDGGSTDGTLTIIDKYKESIDCWVSEPDKGLYNAMNKGIRKAKGELIGMINSDDWYETDAVKLMVNALLNNINKTIFHADRYDVKSNGERSVRKFNPSVFKFKYYGMTYNHPSMFITCREYQKHLYNENLRSHSDYQFVLEALLEDESKFLYIPKVIVNYRLEGISARMSINESVKATYGIRRNLGFTHLECLFALVLMRIVSLTFTVKNLVK